MTDDKIVSLLLTGPKTIAELALAGGDTFEHVRDIVHHMIHEGKVAQMWENAAKYKLAHILIKRERHFTALVWAAVLGILLGSIVTYLVLV